MRDIRIFPIFEGANDVHALLHRAVGAQAAGRGAPASSADFDLGDPIGAIGAWADYALGRVKREVRPRPDHARRIRALGRSPTRSPSRSSACAARARRCCASTARASSSRASPTSATADALSDIYAQIAVLSRVTAIFEDQGVEASGQERFIAETFCTRAARRVHCRARPARAATTTSACTRSPAWPTSAASTATRCSRTRTESRARAGRPALPARGTGRGGGEWRPRSRAAGRRGPVARC